MFWYADELNIIGIVPDYWKGQSQEACQEVLDAYAKDDQQFKLQAKGYPSVEQLKSTIATDEDEAIKSLVEAAKGTEDPIYTLVWGQMKTLKKALFQYPEMASKLRVLSIGTGLKYGPKDEVPEECGVSNWNGQGRDEIYGDARFDAMWWLENNWTYNGMFGGDEPGEMFDKLSKYGALGAHIKMATKRHEWAQYFRVGDTPTVLYLIDQSHDIDDPTEPSWAGKFKKPFPDRRPNYFTDDNGNIEWNYKDPCSTWDNLKEMYSYNKSTLAVERPEMYQALLSKLDKIYN